MQSLPDPVQPCLPLANVGMDVLLPNRRRAPRPVQPPRLRASWRVDPIHRPSLPAVFGVETDRDGFRPAEGHTG
jgi:hypothetical protein